MGSRSVAYASGVSAGDQRTFAVSAHAADISELTADRAGIRAVYKTAVIFSSNSADALLAVYRAAVQREISDNAAAVDLAEKRHFELFRLVYVNVLYGMSVSDEFAVEVLYYLNVRPAFKVDIVPEDVVLVPLCFVRADIHELLGFCYKRVGVPVRIGFRAEIEHLSLHCGGRRRNVLKPYIGHLSLAAAVQGYAAGFPQVFVKVVFIENAAAQSSGGNTSYLVITAGGAEYVAVVIAVCYSGVLISVYVRMTDSINLCFSGKLPGIYAERYVIEVDPRDTAYLFFARDTAAVEAVADLGALGGVSADTADERICGYIPHIQAAGNRSGAVPADTADIYSAVSASGNIRRVPAVFDGSCAVSAYRAGSFSAADTDVSAIYAEIPYRAGGTAEKSLTVQSGGKGQPGYFVIISVKRSGERLRNSAAACLALSYAYRIPLAARQVKIGLKLEILPLISFAAVHLRRQERKLLRRFYDVRVGAVSFTAFKALGGFTVPRCGSRSSEPWIYDEQRRYQRYNCKTRSQQPHSFRCHEITSCKLFFCLCADIHRQTNIMQYYYIL